MLSKVSSPVRSAISSVDDVISAPFRYMASLVGNVEDLFDAYSENKSLKEKISAMEDQSSLVSKLTEENENLSAEIGASSSVSSEFNVIAKVIVRSPMSWYDTLNVEYSNSSSVKEGMLVLSNGGLIGTVSDNTSSKAGVSLLSSGKIFNIPIKIPTSSGDVYGLLQSYDSEKNVFIITNLNSSLSISESDDVLTSGLDASTVAGVSVGRVSSVDESDDSLNTIVYVTPTADFNDIPYVTIVGD